MTDVMPSGLPAVSKVQIGDYLVDSVDARSFHKALKVGRDFATWIKERIESYFFIENQDFKVFPQIGENPSGGRPALDYALTLDMAKELAMVERSAKGRAVRRYFIECERQLKAQQLPATWDAIEVIVEEKIAKAVNVALPRAVAAVLANRLTAIRYGKTAGQIWRLHGYPPIKITRWFSHKLVLAGCQIEGGGRGELGLLRARLFDPDKAERWLRNGGDLLVKRKVLERQGQGRLHLVHGRPSIA